MKSTVDKHEQFDLAIESARKATQRINELRRAMDGAIVMSQEFLEAWRNMKNAEQQMRRCASAALFS